MSGQTASHDFPIVGSGFAGASFARCAAEAGKTSLVPDSRAHVGGNAYGESDRVGVQIHRYVPHIFHTNSDEVLTFLYQFTDWRKYEHHLLAHIDGALFQTPINLTTINAVYKTNFIASALAKARAIFPALGKWIRGLRGPREFALE